MTIKDFLYEEWCEKAAKMGKAENEFYQKYIGPNNESFEIESLFMESMAEASREAFYAGIEAFRRVVLEFGLCGSQQA